MRLNSLNVTRYSAVALILCLLAVLLRESSCFVGVHDRLHHHDPERSSATTRTLLFMSDPQNEGDRDLLSRFNNPIIDDPGLPLADTMVAQIVAPSLQVFWLSLVHAPSPTWLKPIFDNTLWQAQGALLAPTLIHGAGLAFCWLMGALAAQAYRKEAFDPTVDGYGTVIIRIAQAGAFATGLLILGTQIDMFLEFGRYVQPGESEGIDLRLLSAVVELLNDVIFEASCLTGSRLFLAIMTARGKENMNDN